jgi:hypothetical protein
MKPKNIELHIEELVLDGFEESSRRAIGEAVERELSRLFNEHGIPPSLENGGKIDSLDGGTFEMTPGLRAGTVGKRVAQAVYRGLNK